eukprot:111300-Amphidinium_carterae.1
MSSSFGSSVKSFSTTTFPSADAALKDCLGNQGEKHTFRFRCWSSADTKVSSHTQSCADPWTTTSKMSQNGTEACFKAVAHRSKMSKVSESGE